MFFPAVQPLLRGVNHEMKEPSPESGGRGPYDSQQLRSIAIRQKFLLVCVFLYLACVAARFFVPPQVKPLIFFAALLPIVGGTVAVFMLATKTYGSGVGILLGILALIPILGLFVLLVVNGKVTAVLKQADVSVGLFGADLSDL